ncbi:HD domain-containing protein [bacterium]|nr:HD domain-containing protein [bacterium]
MELRNSLFEILNTTEIIEREDILKKILLFLERDINLASAIAIQNENGSEIFYLNEFMELVSKRYHIYPLKTIDKFQKITDLSGYDGYSFFQQNGGVYYNSLEFRSHIFGHIFFFIQEEDDLEIFEKLNRVIIDISFLLDYWEMQDLNQNAIENLVESNRNLAKIETDLIERNHKLFYLTDGNQDFGTITLQPDYTIFEINSYLKNILGFKNEFLKLTDYFSQEEYSSLQFTAFLNKISQKNSTAVTTLHLVSTESQHFVFKVSGAFLPESQNYFLKLYNITSETQIAKKFSKLQAKFDLLLESQTKAIVNSYIGILKGALKFFENKDEDFGYHLERVSEYSAIMVNYIYENNLLNNIVDQEYLEILPDMALLHDIGMLSVKEAILFKDSKLTKEEYEQVKKHVLTGASIFDELLQQFPDSKLLKIGREIVLGHHERYDGSGYPYHLKGHQIPLSAKIISFADIFDGLTTDRIYKKGLPLDLARLMIVDYKGKTIDPFIVDIYLKTEDKFATVFEKYKN